MAGNGGTSAAVFQAGSDNLGGTFRMRTCQLSVAEKMHFRPVCLELLLEFCILRPQHFNVKKVETTDPAKLDRLGGLGYQL